MKRSKTAALSRLQFLDMLQQGAARMGQLDVLKWSLEKHGCACASTHFAWAGSGGHLHVLQWAEENGMEWYSEYLWVSAAQNGHTHILEWIHGFHYVPEDVASYALDYGFAVLDWMKDRSLLNLDCDLIWFEAALGGRIDVLNWLVENRFTDPEGVFDGAAICGRIDVLEWALQHNEIPMTARACYIAASIGHLDVLQWLREHDCPWDSDTILAAHSEGHAAIVQWARDNGCPEPPLFDLFDDLGID